MNKTSTTEKMKAKVVQPQRTYLIICKIADALVADDGPLTDELDCITIPKKDVGVTVNMDITDSTDPNLHVTRYDMAVMDKAHYAGFGFYQCHSAQKWRSDWRSNMSKKAVKKG